MNEEEPIETPQDDSSRGAEVKPTPVPENSTWHDSGSYADGY